jgi:hypothetical protein
MSQSFNGIQSSNSTTTSVASFSNF